MRTNAVLHVTWWGGLISGLLLTTNLWLWAFPVVLVVSASWVYLNERQWR